MKTIFALIFALVFSTSGFASEIVRVPLSDGEVMTGKLVMPPDTAKIGELIIYVHGTGPSTYDKRRKAGDKEFNYFDLFAEGFSKRGAAFFTYSKRGVEHDAAPPAFEKIDREKYKKVLPSVEAKDIGSLIAFLRKDKRLRSAKIVLLGWSEGSIIASMVAEDPKNKVAALFLAGYANENLRGVIAWQNTGGSAIVNIRPYFDTDKNNSISRAEYESDAKPAVSFRTRAFGGAKFEQLDVNKDEAIDVEDFRLLSKDRYKAILDAVEKGDDDWIWNNYFHITTAWLKEHFALEANKTRLLRQTIPIYIFQGENDANCPVEGVYDLRARFDKAGKKNLHEFVFKGHNHDLNYQDWISKGEISEGIKKMFKTAEQLK